MANPETLHAAHIVESFGGGTLTAVSYLCKALGDGFSHTVIHSLRAETPENFMDMFPASVRFIKVDMNRKIDAWRDFSAYCELARVLPPLRPDLVHCHSAKAGFLGRAAAWSCGIPSIYTPHSYSFLQNNLPRPVRWFYWCAEWAATRLGTAIAACGEEEYRLARKLGGAGYPVAEIKNAVVLDDIKEPSFAVRPGERLKVGMCGRFAPQRDPDHFFHVARSLGQEADFVWVGAEKGLPGFPASVEATGWLRRTESLARAEALDVYIQTSLWEGLSYGILEAMAMGKPVVATRIPANESVIKHGETGFLSNGPEDTVRHVRELLRDAALREKIGRAARAVILEKHDANVAYKAYGDFYRRVAALKNQPDGSGRVT